MDALPPSDNDHLRGKLIEDLEDFNKKFEGTHARSTNPELTGAMTGAGDEQARTKARPQFGDGDSPINVNDTFLPTEQEDLADFEGGKTLLDYLGQF